MFGFQFHTPLIGGFVAGATAMNERTSERSLKVRRRQRPKGVQGVGSTCARDGCCKRCARVMWGHRLGGGWGPRKLWVNTGTKKAGEEGIPWTVHCDGPNGPLSCHVMWGTGPNREEMGGPNGTIFAFFPRWWSLRLVRWSDPACGPKPYSLSSSDTCPKLSC
ncbi:hypothetical protein PVK06_037962 [Gossypium arboreum]|uniref:Uncharacterized protein n=1 Tax=Gossypium arboreum TaxID=29729 RepID=A0ABR0MYU5_GOSAR|nr:hypothetical protein PVK06_037962 [Gossypium arboreum]